MSGPSKVIVVEPDPRAARQIQLGFEREGVPTVVPNVPADAAQLELAPDGEAGLVIVGGADGDGLELVRRAKEMREAAHGESPIVFVGRGVTRAAAEAAGADEIVMRPAYLRDLVTIGRLLRGVPAHQRDHLVGSLVETTGVFTLVRALAALGRSATLTLIRGLRRGEIRFYLGEVTSAQVGLIHGQAALHQLILWTDARFDFAHEDIVRRQQIPLSSEELFADAERFLEGVREAAGKLSPATVLEQNVSRIHELGPQIPHEVIGVLRMFDGHRVLADVLEDSPYRVFETLRVTQKAVEVGLLRTVEAQRPKATWRAVLAIEEWLVGNETRESVVERTSSMFDSSPNVNAKKWKKRKKRKRTVSAAVPVALPQTASGKVEIDWATLVPRGIGAEVGPLSGVVPAMATAGEVEIASRAAQREGLEALMDTDKRQRIFPTDIGLEPSVVVRSSDTDEWERIEWEAKSRALEEEKAKEAQAKAQETVERMKLEHAAQEEAEARARAIVQAATEPVAEDSPSDGVVRAMLATADTGQLERERLAREPERAPIVPDVPALTETTGEIRQRTPTTPPPVSGVEGEPSILVSDLAAAHTAITAAFSKVDTTPPADAASPSRELAVSEVRKDAVAFSEAEEAFFTRADRTAARETVKPETFDDLDEGYEPTKFWDRVFGRRKRPPGHGVPPVKKK